MADITFSLTKSGQVDYTTVVIVPTQQTTASSSTNTLTLRPILPPKPALPRQYAKHDGLSNKLSEERQLQVLKAIEFRKTLNSSDVEFLLLAAEQHFPLAFRSQEKFEQSLLTLVERTSGFNKTKLLGDFKVFTEEEAPTCIMIHGSSIGGLRGKKKDPGWRFGPDSDIDVSIIDLTRFCWAQALGITTYSDCNTIELNDPQLHLLKLHKFAEGFRRLCGNYQANFMIYSTKEFASKHSGFTLVCDYDKSIREFKITKIYSEERIESMSPDKGSMCLTKFFKIDDSILLKETVATNTILDDLRKEQTTVPTQGNHLFNDLHHELKVLKRSMKQNLACYLTEEQPGVTFAKKYFHLLGECADMLEIVSRDEVVATKIHKTNKLAIQTGFDIKSDSINERLFGNALLYFCNCSIALCLGAIKSFGNKKQVVFIALPLKKAFSNLVNSLIDEPLVKKLGTNRKSETYASQQADIFNTTIRPQVLRHFKTQLDFLIDSIHFVELINFFDLDKLTGQDLEEIFDDHNLDHRIEYLELEKAKTL